MTYDIECPMCNMVVLKTNHNYTDKQPANGSMFELKEHYKESGWGSFPLYESSQYGNLTCPSCDGFLVDSSGYIIRKHARADDDGKVDCPCCDGRYKPFGLKNHLKFKHPEYTI